MKDVYGRFLRLWGMQEYRDMKRPLRRLVKLQWANTPWRPQYKDSPHPLLYVHLFFEAKGNLRLFQQHTNHTNIQGETYLPAWLRIRKGQAQRKGMPGRNSGTSFWIQVPKRTEKTLPPEMWPKKKKKKNQSRAFANWNIQKMFFSG